LTLPLATQAGTYWIGALVDDAFAVAESSEQNNARASALSITVTATPLPDLELTAVGVAVGSPTYMSPEQVFGPSVDSATDRYAFGIILYIAVAKRPPFRHDDRVQLVLMHKRNPVPPLNSIVPQIPLNHPLDKFFGKALAKQPTERFPSAKVMIEEFIRAMDEAPLPLFGDAPASTQSARSVPSKASEQRPLASQAAPAGPGSMPPKRPPPPPPTAAAKAPAPLPSVGPALRTTLPVASAEPAAESARARADGVRSIEAWGARVAKAPAQAAEPRQAGAPAATVEAVSSAPGHRRLLACLGNSSEAIDVLSAQQVTLGKHRDCDIVVRAFPTPENDSITHGVSRQHARMLVANGKLLVEDMRSLNGTFVDDRRLALGTQMALSDGQLVRLGPVLTIEVRIFKSGGALLRRIDEYHGGFPATLLIWKDVALGDPVLGLVPAGGDAAVRWGTVRAHGEQGELWWFGPQAVLWQRSGRSLSGAQSLLPGDRMTLGSTVVEWETGIKPGLS